MSNILYTLIIYPLQLLVELTYRVFIAVFSGREGVAIVGISAVITVLCLPLYDKAEKWQKVERDKVASMKKGLARIKKAFTGDEQYMITQTFYKENHYNPIMALRSSFGLLVQIPFFIAAYQFLSNNKELLGKTFLFIKDLGSPDQLFSLFSFKVNILPIAMTAINIVSGAIYTKGHPLREKLQVYIMALVFLVILYNSSSALVLYWTMNNLFGLVKNIFYKLPSPLLSFWGLSSFLMIATTIYLLLTKFERVGVFIFASPFLLLLPFLVRLCKKFFSRPLSNIDDMAKKEKFLLFALSSLSLSILVGCAIPSLLMADSPIEYCFVTEDGRPLPFLWNSTIQALGLLFFYPLLLYFLFGKRAKSLLIFTFFLISISALVNNFCFQGDYGNVLPEIEFTEHKSFFPSVQGFLLNFLALALLFAFIFFLFSSPHKKVLNFLSVISCLCVLGLSLINIIKVSSFFKKASPPPPQLALNDKVVKLSKTHKNVLVIMLDAATGYTAQKVFEIRPSLLEDFEGFVTFPNCFSFGLWTIQGSPAFYGGYEYTPYAMNSRRCVPMKEKHNEALSLQAKIFSSAGYQCSVFNPPYPNYDEPPVYQAFDKLERTSCKKITGRYTAAWCEEHNFTLANLRAMNIRRNFLLFGLFKSLPLIARPFLAFHNFWAPAVKSHEKDLKNFIDNYSTLDYLPRLTDATMDRDCFVILDSELTHDKVLTQLPDFTPSNNVDNSKYTFENPLYDNKELYNSGAAFTLLGKFFRHLKEIGCYDNTRVIISADHGSWISEKEAFARPPALSQPIVRYNPCLFVKDFDAQGPMQVDTTFMSNADTPALALDGLIENPVNPFTNESLKLLTTVEKNKKAIISSSKTLGVLNQKDNGFAIEDYEWWQVHDNIFDKDNWTHLINSPDQSWRLPIAPRKKK